MANDLQQYDPTTISKPEWFERLTASVTRTENGLAILPAGATLTSQQRSWLSTTSQDLRSFLTPAPGEEGAVASAVMGMFAAFPVQALSERAAEARMGAYLETLTQYPAWAVRKAVGMWLSREEGSPGDNYAFPPSPPQLVRLVKLALRPLYQRIHEYEGMLAAKPDLPPPSPEQQARVQSIVDGFLKPMPGSGDAA